MKGYVKNMKTITKVDFATYLGVILAFIVVSVCQAQGLVNRSLGGMLVPICCYVCMSISLNLTVGILGELSLGHAGFMSVGAFSGIIAAMSLQSAVPNDLVRMIVALVVGAFFAAIVGFIVGIPVLRLRGDYLAIVTLAFGEIIKDLINCLLVGWDENGLGAPRKPRTVLRRLPSARPHQQAVHLGTVCRRRASAHRGQYRRPAVYRALRREMRPRGRPHHRRAA